MQDTSAVYFQKYRAGETETLTLEDTIVSNETLFRFEDSATLVPGGSRTVSSPVTYINFFTGHELPLIHPRMDAIPNKDSTPSWLFFILLVIIAALAWIRYYFGKIFKQTLQALINVNITNQIVRDENVLLQRTSSFLGVIFNIVFALILYHASNYFGWNIFDLGKSFGKFLFLLLAVSAVYSIKFLLLKLIGFIFSIEKEMATYIFNIFLINNMLGLLLIPFAILLSFSVIMPTGILVIVGCVLYGLALNYRIFRGVLIGLSFKGVNLMYLFLYFCALEFAPALVLLKMVTH